MARIQLEKAEINLNAFSRKAGIVSLASNLNLIYTQLEGANKAYLAAQSERLNKESLYNQSKEGPGSLPSIVESQLIQKLRGDYIALTAEYKEASVTFKDDYPKLQNLKAKMSNIENQIKVEENRVVDSIKNDYFSALKKEEILKKDTENKKALAMELNDRATQYKILDAKLRRTNRSIIVFLNGRGKSMPRSEPKSAVCRWWTTPLNHCRLIRQISHKIFCSPS